MVKGKHITICFHIDACKISHKSSAVIDDTTAWLRVDYESIFEEGLGQMKVHRGKTHKYLGMSLDFSHKGQCKSPCMKHDYIDGILQAYDLAIKNQWIPDCWKVPLQEKCSTRQSLYSQWGL